MKENVLIHKLLEVFEYKSEYQRQTSDIQPQDMYVLERIYFNEKIGIKEISRRYNIPPSTLTGIIDRLEKKALVERLRTSEDRRAVEVAATENGKVVVERHIEEDIIFSSNFFNTLDQEKQEKFKELLGELLDHISLDTLFSRNNE